MVLIYIITSIAFAGLLLVSRSERMMKALGWIYYGLQAAFGVWILWGNVGDAGFEFFNLDRTGTLFFILLAVISPVVYYYSLWYLDTETFREKRLYNALLILLCMSITCVYFSNNAAITWIFLEASTLCTAGLIYHRRSARSLEATWKYIFVCSVGIAMAYLGVLLLGSIAQDGNMSYSALAANAANGNPLYMKIAFLFVFIGYSCKMEVFPLYSIGIDGNFAAPTPASALISTGLVNAGFIAIFRIYKVMGQTAITEWVSGVLIIAGLIAVLIGAVFLRRTNHYKRFLSYSTVENMGVVAIGLGVGGIGVFAAILHLAAHTLIKSAMFLQMSQVGKTYGHYQINRIGNYMNTNRSRAAMILVTTVLLLGFPPSPLFVSEVMIFKQLMTNGQWWMLVVLVLMLCMVIYNFGYTMLRLCYQNNKGELLNPKIGLSLVLPIFFILAGTVVFGMWQPQWLVKWINVIVW